MALRYQRPSLLTNTGLSGFTKLNILSGGLPLVQVVYSDIFT